MMCGVGGEREGAVMGSTPSRRHVRTRLAMSGRKALAVTLVLAVATVAAVVAVGGIGSGARPTVVRAERRRSSHALTLAQLIASHTLASTARVLPSQPSTSIVQFPLFPSGVKALFPKATGVVTIVQGNPEVSLFDTVTVDVSNMPPDTTFTVFLIEQATKPFGHVQYVADLHTRGDGSGDVTFQTITLVAFAADATNPGVSRDQSGDASGIQLEHLGMWFSSLDSAQKVLRDPTIK